MMLFVIYSLITYFHFTSSVKCPSCPNISFNATQESTLTSILNCTNIVNSTSVCISELTVMLTSQYPAIVEYITAPLNALITTNVDSALKTTIEIPLDAGTPYASVMYRCYDKSLCNMNISARQYEEVRKLNYTKLTEQLTDFLYDRSRASKGCALECFNRGKRKQKCNENESCQATMVIEPGRVDLLSTSCVAKRLPGATVGISFVSESDENGRKITTLSYMCNKNRCNYPSTIHKVYKMLVKANPISSVASKLTTFSFLTVATFMMIRVYLFELV